MNQTSSNSAENHSSSFAAIKVFLVPDSSISLKTVFDNVRNTLIAMSVVLGGNWAATHDIPLMVHGASQKVVSLPMIWIGLSLSIFNVLQTAVIFQRAINEFRWRDSGVLTVIFQLWVVGVLFSLQIFIGFLALAFAGRSGAGF